uniref:Uncharacterized protein n=1 Tax=Rhodnius prolixus TaxID=13249 RepID=T1HP32_RHOPR
MSEAEAMLKSLKRKDSNDSSLDPAAKKPRNSEIECIVISGTDSESPVPDLCQVASTEKQNGEVLSKNGRSIISINLESDSENDVPNVGLTTTVVPECDVEMVTLADSNQITKENKDKIEAPDERKLSKCTVEEEPAEQPSFSLNDEVQHFSVILLSDSEDDEQASQLFSQHVESSSLMAPYDQLKIKNEVTENYEVRMNEYDDEDRPIEDSNFGMFEEHFIHCSQEISLLESTKSLETNSSTSQSADKNSFIMKANSIREGIDDCNDVFIEDGSSSAVHISSDDLQKKQETIDCEKTLTKDDTLKMTDSEFPTKIREVKHLSKRKPRQ